jgi:hypothetical protein
MRVLIDLSNLNYPTSGHAWLSIRNDLCLMGSSVALESVE